MFSHNGHIGEAKISETETNDSGLQTMLCLVEYARWRHQSAAARLCLLAMTTCVAGLQRVV